MCASAALEDLVSIDDEDSIDWTLADSASVFGHSGLRIGRIEVVLV